LKTLSFDRNKLLYECKVSWNIIMKGIEILILKGFSVIYVKSMVREWCGILVIHRQWKGEKIFMQTRT
jgi:hypothetical protein